MATEIYQNRVVDTAAESVYNDAAHHAAMETHLDALQDKHAQMGAIGTRGKPLADLELQIARTLVELGRGEEAWLLARKAFDMLLEHDDFESAADACNVLFLAEQPQSVAALGQGIWLAVSYPIDPELTVDLLKHVVDETPDDADGAAVAATTALFLADMRATGRQHDSLTFFASQLLADVARRHSNVENQEQFDLWMERLELKEPEKFLVRLRNVVDVLVQEDWWFDRAELQSKMPMN